MWFRRSQQPPFHALVKGPAPEGRILEISTRSADADGRRMSAMNLRVAGEAGGEVALESAYQAAKDFGAGPDTRIETLDGFEAKRRSKERAARMAAAGCELAGFTRGGVHWPAASGTAFYDRLWLEGALNAYGDRLGAVLRPCLGFSDCFFRPGPAHACQAAAAATAAVLLEKLGRRPDAELRRALETPAGYAAWREVETETVGDAMESTAAMARVVDKRTHQPGPGDVYVCRPGPWGNPFRLEAESGRADVLRRYREWLVSQVRSGGITREALAGLAGRTLVCWCAPRACHGHVLALAAAWAAGTETLEEAAWTSAPIDDAGHLAAA